MAVKVCSSCGEDNKENAVICASCNKTLHDATIRGTLDSDKNQNSSTKSSIKFCSKCNERLEVGALKCKYCQTPTIKAKKAPTTYNSQQTYGSGKSYFLLYLVTFLIPFIGLIVGGIISFDDDPEKSEAGKGILIFGIIMIVVSAIFWTIVISSAT
ncbi:hypothetical protein EHS13_15425 [Paenibacillus psychroresistens]|uniref:DZANK-type domain-containing protein n=1 Tax=Paenibacillus psychroresistens TaxID=1778678 RepID=A0A6B8RJZ8_9BACL|nr:hypothetical protein [Paenibacillus psychroresistens]QGQ96167.1 hypothetical protein EHS13_15425 [Paenibacillus psychroresistens]